MVPKYLYKYQSLDGNNLALQNLQKRQVYFQHPSKFDDPYDCAIQIIREISDDDVGRLWESWERGEINKNLPFDTYFSQYQTDGKPNDKFKQAIAEPFEIMYMKEREKILNRWGVSCFSARNDILLMWSHYGNSHKGFCLEFDTTYNPFSKAREVSYPEIEEIPSFSPLDILTQRAPALRPMVLTKAMCWKYQEEWRIFMEDGGKPQVYDKRCLTRIFFGAKSSRQDQLKILGVLRDAPTQCYIMEKDSRSFRLKPIEYAQWLGKQSDFLSS